MLNRPTSSSALSRAIFSFDTKLTATIARKTGTVSRTNIVRMLGRSRMFFAKRLGICATRNVLEGGPDTINDWRFSVHVLPAAVGG